MTTPTQMPNYLPVEFVLIHDNGTHSFFRSEVPINNKVKILKSDVSRLVNFNTYICFYYLCDCIYNNPLINEHLFVVTIYYGVLFNQRKM